MTGALEGVKVIGFEQVAAMPSCSVILADWGADVIKIEPPWGDWVRSYVSQANVPLVKKYDKGEIAFHFELLNRNKRSMVIDLRQDRGREIVYHLLEDADVFVINYSIDVIEKYHLDYHSLKERYPGLIHCLITGYGTEGPLKYERGYDHTAAWCFGGPMSLIGEPDSAPPLNRPGMFDLVAGANMAAGICAALYHRQKTGEGQSLELSLYNTAVWSLGADMQSALFGHPLPKQSRRNVANPMFNVYRTKDGRWLHLVGLSQDFWIPFCRALGKPGWENDSRYSTMESRSKYCEELIAEIDRIMSARTLEEWEKCLKDYDLIFSVMQTPSQVCREEQAMANDFFAEVEHPVAGQIRLLNTAVKFSKTGAQIRKVAPTIGQHTEEILLEHGYTWEDMRGLKDEVVIP